MSFIFGAEQSARTPEELARQRAIVEALLQRNSGRTPQNLGEGLTAVGNAIAARIRMSQLNRQETAGRKSATDVFSGATTNYQWPGASPAPTANPKVAGNVAEPNVNIVPAGAGSVQQPPSYYEPPRASSYATPAPNNGWAAQKAAIYSGAAPDSFPPVMDDATQIGIPRMKPTNTGTIPLPRNKPVQAATDNVIPIPRQKPITGEPLGNIGPDASLAPQGSGVEGIKKALLDTISGPESGGKYDVMYGGKRFADFSDHPRQLFPIMSGPNKGKKSSAAGRYQFIRGTWDKQKADLGLKDFSPASQDAAAWDLASDTFKDKTGQDLASVLQSGDPNAIAQVGKALSGVWTSLPGGIEQGIGGNRFVSAYNKNMGAPSTTPATMEAGMPDGVQINPASAAPDPQQAIARTLMARQQPDMAQQMREGLPSRYAQEWGTAQVELCKCRANYREEGTSKPFPHPYSTAEQVATACARNRRNPM